MHIHSRWTFAIAILGCGFLTCCFRQNVPYSVQASSPNHFEIALDTLQSITIPEEAEQADMAPVAAIYYSGPIVISRPPYDDPSSEKPTEPPGDIKSVLAKLYPDDLIVVLWPNGQILWSDDHVRGGPPYYMGQIKKKMIGQFFQQLSRCQAFEPNLFGKHTLLYIECGRTEMVAVNGTQAMNLCSVHERVGELDYQSTKKGEVWKKVKRHMIDLTREAVSVRRITGDKKGTSLISAQGNQ